jgi:uncharacterized membrane protein
MAQKSCNRMSRDKKKGSSPQLVVVRLQSVSAVTCLCMCACVLCGQVGDSLVRAVGTVTMLVTWSEILEVCCFFISTCDR